MYWVYRYKKIVYALVIKHMNIEYAGSKRSSENHHAAHSIVVLKSTKKSYTGFFTSAYTKACKPYPSWITKLKFLLYMELHTSLVPRLSLPPSWQPTQGPFTQSCWQVISQTHNDAIFCSLLWKWCHHVLLFTASRIPIHQHTVSTDSDLCTIDCAMVSKAIAEVVHF